MSIHAANVAATIETDKGTSAIIASWRRCSHLHGLDPDLSTAPRQDLPAWRTACAAERALVEATDAGLDHLFGLLRDSDCAVLLTDRRGLVLNHRTSRTADSWGRKPAEWYGTLHGEARLGTNAIGTCIVEQRAVIVRAHEHFLTRYTDRTGIAVPLYGPDGVLVGTLSLDQDRSAHDARLDAFLSITVANYARRAEAEMFARAHPAARLMLASATGCTPEALLAVDCDDRVIGATRGARRLLSICDEIIASAPNVDELLGATQQRHHEALAEAERRAILRALSRVGGNVSAAARAIRISRSTLYRKLAAYRIDAVGGDFRPRLSDGSPAAS